MNNYETPLKTYDKLVDTVKDILDCTNGNNYVDEYRALSAKYETIKKNPSQVEREEALLKSIQTLHKAMVEVGIRVRETLEEDLDKIVIDDTLVISINYPHATEERKLAAQEDFVNKLSEMTLPLEILTKTENIGECVKKIEEIEDLASIFEEIDDSGIVDTTKEIEVPVVEEQPKVTEEVIEEQPESDFPIGLPMSSDDVFARTELVVEETPSQEVIDDQPEEAIQIEEPTQIEEKPSGKVILIKKAIDKAKEKNNLQLVKLLEQQLVKETENI